MGTSISQPSPNNTNWKASKIIYKHGKIPANRVIKEIWRASENHENPMSNKLGTKSIFSCQEIVRESKNVSEALKKFRATTIKNKDNSILSEFAKRAIPHAMASKNPVAEWRATFFSNITNYIVSRDISGYIGEEFRNKNVGQMMKFKSQIRQNVHEQIHSIEKNPKSLKSWKKYVEGTITQLKEKK